MVTNKVSIGNILVGDSIGHDKDLEAYPVKDLESYLVSGVEDFYPVTTYRIKEAYQQSILMAKNLIL